MNAATEPFAPSNQLGWAAWLQRELAPTSGRPAMTLRIVIVVVLVTIISMALQTPTTAISAYMVLFVTKEHRALTTLTGLVTIVGMTTAIAASVFLYTSTFDYPELRIPAMAIIIFAGMFLSRTCAIGPLGFAVGFVVSYAQTVADTIPNTDSLVRNLLWLWMIVVFPIVITVIVNRFLLVKEAAPALAKAKRTFFVPDAFTNPAHVRFALKVTLAAMTCYLIYTGLGWPGIHTAFITCCFIALETTGATIRKGWLRLLGCCVGGSLGFLSIVFLIPRMESIVPLLLLVAAGTALAGWVAAGSQRIAYAGLQIGFAFFMCLFQGFQPETNFTVIRDRLVGIVLGLLVSTAIFRYLWPEE